MAAAATIEEREPARFTSPRRVPARGGGSSVRQAEFEPENVVAADGVNRRPIAPTLAGHLPDHALAPGGHGLGDFLAQIKISTHTLVVRATE